MKDKRKYQNALDRIATTKDMAVYMLIGGISILLCILWYGLINIGGWIPATVVLVLYFGAIAWWSNYRVQRDVGIPNFTLSAELESTLGNWMNNMHMPSLICSDTGVLVWHNHAFADCFGVHAPNQGDDIAGILPLDDPTRRVAVGDRVYKVLSTRVLVKDKHYIFLQMQDISELRDSEKAYDDDRMAIGFVSIDNLQSAMQYTNESMNDTVLEVDTKLRRWAMKNNFILLAYDTDKYMLLLDTKQLMACIEDRFSVLDEIRNTHVGDGISITVSMGIARVGGSLAEREKAAESAHEMALQRGGDQVVCKNGTVVEVFGGRTKAVYKRTNVKARVFATQLCAEIRRATNVIIMGHQNGDNDSVGAAIGMAKLVRMCGVKYHIVYSKNDKNTAPVSFRIPPSVYASRFFLHYQIETIYHYFIIIKEQGISALLFDGIHCFQTPFFSASSAAAAVGYAFVSKLMCALTIQSAALSR